MKHVFFHYDRWVIWSDALKMRATITELSPVEYSVYTEDGVLYSAAELLAMRFSGATVSLEAHLIKKAFGGTISQIAKKQRSR